MVTYMDGLGERLIDAVAAFDSRHSRKDGEGNADPIVAGEWGTRVDGWSFTEHGTSEVPDDSQGAFGCQVLRR